jgi:hypothetical protein
VLVGDLRNHKINFILIRWPGEMGVFSSVGVLAVQPCGGGWNP